MLKDGELFSSVIMRTDWIKYECSYRDGLKHGSELIYDEYGMITEGIDKLKRKTIKKIKSY